MAIDLAGPAAKSVGAGLSINTRDPLAVLNVGGSDAGVAGLRGSGGGGGSTDSVPIARSAMVIVAPVGMVVMPSPMQVKERKRWC